MANITYTTSNTFTFGRSTKPNIQASKVLKNLLIALAASGLVIALSISTLYFMFSSIGG